MQGQQILASKLLDFKFAQQLQVVYLRTRFFHFRMRTNPENAFYDWREKLMVSRALYAMFFSFSIFWKIFSKFFFAKLFFPHRHLEIYVSGVQFY